MKTSLILSAILGCISFVTIASEPIQSTDKNDAIAKSKQDDEQIEHLAIATLANMAQGIVNIGNHSDDPKVVEKEVANIMANFTAFVVQAMKNPNALKMLDEEELFKFAAARIRSMRLLDQKESSFFAPDRIA